MRRTDGQSNTSRKDLPKRNFRFSSGDVCILLVIVCFCIFLIAGMWVRTKISKDSAPYVRITKDGQVLLERPLSDFSEPVDYLIYGERGSMNIYISSEKVCVTDSSCPDKICMHQGDLVRPGDGAVCLPNRVVVEIVSGSSGDSEGKVDVVSK